MEECLAPLALRTLPAGNDYNSLLRLHVHYRDRSAEGFDDFYARISKARDVIKDELLQGTVDKLGNSRDAEKRAVLYHLTRILAFPREIARQFAELDKKRQEMEARASKKLKIHADDVLTSSWNE